MFAPMVGARRGLAFGLVALGVPVYLVGCRSGLGVLITAVLLLAALALLAVRVFEHLRIGGRVRGLRLAERSLAEPLLVWSWILHLRWPYPQSEQGNARPVLGSRGIELQRQLITVPWASSDLQTEAVRFARTLGCGVRAARVDGHRPEVTRVWNVCQLCPRPDSNRDLPA